MQAPTDSERDAYLIVCASHGELTDRPAADHIAADLVASEHRENCSAVVTIHDVDDVDFEPASELATEDPELAQTTFSEGEGT